MAASRSSCCCSCARASAWAAAAAAAALSSTVLVEAAAEAPFLSVVGSGAAEEELMGIEAVPLACARARSNGPSSAPAEAAAAFAVDAARSRPPQHAQLMSCSVMMRAAHAASSMSLCSTLHSAGHRDHSTPGCALRTSDDSSDGASHRPVIQQEAKREATSPASDKLRVEFITTQRCRQERRQSEIGTRSERRLRARQSQWYCEVSLRCE